MCATKPQVDHYGRGKPFKLAGNEGSHARGVVEILMECFDHSINSVAHPKNHPFG
jgi:hypothetical protein